MHFLIDMHFLKDIATIRSGYLFREKIEPDLAGRYQVVQIGGVSTNATLSNTGLTRTTLPDVKPSQILESGDVLFISRGPRKQAVAIIEPIEQTIATSQFFILHPNESVLPEFLAWYINQRPAQRYIEAHSRGSAVSLLNLEALKRLPLEPPPLKTQERIVQIHQLSLRERELLDAIREKRGVLIERTLINAAQRGER